MRWLVWVAMLGIGLGAQVPNAMESGYRHLYNLQFPAAHADFQAWMVAHPDDPLGPASDAAVYLFAELNHLQVLQAQFFSRDATFFSGREGVTGPAFTAELARSEALAAAALTRTPDDTNALYSQVLCHGLRADDLAIVHRHALAAVREMNRGRAEADHLLQLDPGYADAYLALGIENYVLGQRAAPVRWMLRLTGAATDKAAGLDQLRETAAHGRTLQPFAQILLAIAAVRANQFSAARDLLRQLTSNFPANPLFAQELARLGTAGATLDVAASQIQFTLGAFLHTVHGTFSLHSGSLRWDPESGVATGAVLIPAASGNSGNADRDRDMRDKVLRAGEYPDIVFTPARLSGTPAAAGVSHVTLHGSLQMAGTVHPLDLPLSVTVSGRAFTAEGGVDIPYVAWGLKNPSNLLLRVDKTVHLTLRLRGTISLPDGGGP